VILSIRVTSWADKKFNITKKLSKIKERSKRNAEQKVSERERERTRRKNDRVEFYIAINIKKLKILSFMATKIQPSVD
jgi:hypothetical protein